MSSHNSHHQQIYISNRVYLKHNVMAELEKIQFGLCMPEGLVKTASRKLFSACEPRMLLKKKVQQFFYGYFSENKRTTGNLVNTFHCSGADVRNLSRSLHEAASVVNTLCHPNSVDILQFVNMSG